MNQWVEHPLIKPIYFGKLFNRRVIISELEFSLNNNNAIGSSVFAQDKTEAQVFAEVVNFDASVNTERNKIGITFS